MAETAFGVTYDGPALVDGRMPVRDLAPALLALGDVFAEASAVLYPNRDPVALNIKATAEGSFDVHLILQGSGLWDQVIGLLNTDEADALANLIGITGGLFGFILWVRRRAIKREDRIDPGTIRVTLTDEDTIEVPADVVELYRNGRIRRRVREVVMPLERPGVDRLDLRMTEDTTVHVTTADVPAFELPDEAEAPLLETDTEMVLAITSVVFRQGNKWRFSRGEGGQDGEFYATVEDRLFLDRVDKGIESFRNGDFLRCRVRMVQTQRDGRLHTEYFVTEVLDHRPPSVQLILTRYGGDG